MIDSTKILIRHRRLCRIATKFIENPPDKIKNDINKKSARRLYMYIGVTVEIIKYTLK